MMTKIDVPTPKDKEKLREEIKRQTKEFLAKGGTITKLAAGESAHKGDINYLIRPEGSIYGKG
jgi:hypothetical protein